MISISSLLFCSIGITLPRSDASLFCSFVPQGLFRLAGCIPVWLFFTTGITLPRSDASLSCSFVPQGLFRPTGCIPSLLFCSTGIISTGRMHLYLALLFHRDYFDRLNASLSGSFVPRGLFRPFGFTPVLLFCAAGIISADQMHPITGRPSLKASLPGHSVNFRFV